MKNYKLTATDILSIMRSTVNPDLISRCKRELAKSGYKAIWDSYVGWILI